MTTSIKRRFAGEDREFRLIHRSGYEAPYGDLTELVQAARIGDFGVERVRHVLIHGLARGEVSRLLDATQIVDEEMEDRPLVDFMPLAVDIVVAAFSGADSGI